MLLIRRIPLGPYETNAYMLVCVRTMEAALIDPASDPELLLEEVGRFNVRYIIVTHGHPDHIGALAVIRSKLSAQVAYHIADKARIEIPPDIGFADGMGLVLGDYRLQVLHLPGHTAGSAGILVRSDLFGGDTLFPGGPGRTDSPEDLVKLVHTLKEKLFTLPDETAVYPGHGAGTTIGREREASRAFIERVEAGWRGSGDLTWETR